MFMLAVFPVMTPGLMVQLPDGKPFNTTLPLGVKQVGWVMVPAVGAVGIVGWASMTTFVVTAEVHPEALVTLKLYMPVERAGTFVLVPEPVMLTGLIVQFPDGNPLSNTLPVDVKQVGCVIDPTAGVAGEPGAALISILAEAKDMHPAALVTV